MESTLKKRITRKALHIQIAELISLRGTCGRLKVGAIATLENRIIATGYNGPPKGEPHCNNKICDLSKPCTRAKHAEENLINWAKDNNISLEGSTMYVTCQPCIMCAKMIKEAKIKKVFYLNPYRLTDGLIYLKINGINVNRITRTGARI